MTELGVSLLGYGFMGGAHSRAFSLLRTLEEHPAAVPRLVSICGRDSEAVERVRGRYGWESAVPKWQEQVGDKRVAIFDNAGPNCVHLEPTVAAARAGKHVLCEKPLGRNAAEALRLRDEAERAGVVHMCGFNLRFLPAVRLAKELLEADELGDLTHFRARFLASSALREDQRRTWRFDAAQAGSGAVADLGSHIVDLARYLVGEPIAVCATTMTQVATRDGEAVDVDDAFAATVEFATGAIGTLEASRVAGRRSNVCAFEVDGTRGSLSFDIERLNELELVRNRKQSTRIDVTAPDHPFMELWWPAPGPCDRLGRQLRPRAAPLPRLRRLRALGAPARRGLRGRVPLRAGVRRDPGGRKHRSAPRGAFAVKTATTLAIAGGVAAVDAGAHRSWPEITQDDRAAIARVLDRGTLWGPNAPEVTALQEEWAQYVGTRFCLLTNSGTAALHCAVAAAGVRAGDEVIVPAFSFVATPMAVLHQGAVPVFCDIDPQIHTIDPRLIEAHIGPRTRAIMPVHAHGLPADMEEIRAVARRNGLAVIEDAAQAHGAVYRGTRTGALGDCAGFSLNGSKGLSAGEGGLFVTDDEASFLTARRLAIFGEDTPPTGPGQYRAYWSHGVGWNYRSHELTAALARSQLRRLDDYNRIARNNARLLNAALAGLPGIHPPHVPDDRSCVFYRYRIVIEPEELGFTGPPVELRDRLLYALQAEGVAASLWQLRPLPEQPVFRHGGRFAPWQPGAPKALDRFDPGAYPKTTRLLQSSIVIGTAELPLFNQPRALMSRYAEAFEKVMGDLETVFRADHRPVQPVPPAPEEHLGYVVRA